MSYKIYTLFPRKKQSHRIFSIILFRTDQDFIKFGGLIPEFTRDTTAVALPMNPV